MSGFTFMMEDFTKCSLVTLNGEYKSIHSVAILKTKKIKLSGNKYLHFSVINNKILYCFGQL